MIWREAFPFILMGAMVWVGTVCAQESQPQSPAAMSDVSIIQLIAAPEKHHGSYVRVTGYVRLEFEANAIYLSKEDERYGLTKNGLWLEIPADMAVNAKQYDGKFCLVEGTFISANQGHLCLWSGAIESIKRFEVWIKNG